MKILYYSPHPDIKTTDNSGYGTHIREMVGAFKQLGHDVQVLAIGDSFGSPVSNDGTRKNFKAIIKKITPRIFWETMKDINLKKIDKKNEKILEKTVSEFNPDLIYERGYYFMTSGITVAKKNNLKHYLELNAPYIEEKKEMSSTSLFKGFALKMTQKLLQASNKIIVVSSALKDYYSELAPFAIEKIIVVSNGINLGKIHVDEKNALTLKNKYNFSSEDFIVGFVGSIFPYHGVDLLLDSLPLLLNTHPKIKLFIIGDGEILPELKKRAIANKVAEHVVFAGSVENEKIYDYIQIMNLTIMPKSNWYGSPVKIFEYGAMCKPVIAPGTIPVRDVMIDGIDGILIVQNNLSDLVNAILKCANDEIFSKKIAMNFFTKVTASHTWIKKAEFILKNEN